MTHPVGRQPGGGAFPGATHPLKQYANDSQRSLVHRALLPKTAGRNEKTRLTTRKARLKSGAETSGLQKL